MTKRLLVIMAVVGGLFACTAQSHEKAEIKTKLDSMAYALGMQWGKNFKNDSLMFNPDIVAQGVKDALYEEKTLFTEEEMRATLMKIQEMLRERDMKKRSADSLANVGKGKEFLEKNKNKEGVKTTASGLQYKVIKEGTGKSPVATDKVTVHYTGTLIDGTKFDSSVDRGKPATFGLNQVIRGWTEGLQLMKEGGKYMFYIPAELGYGPRATGNIPPMSTLIFEVELIKVGQ